MKPTILIRSSTEALPLARAVQENLQDPNLADAEAVISSENFIDKQSAYLEALLKHLPPLEALLTAIEVYDFAVFIFSAADALTIEGKRMVPVRHNIMFEFGLFLGKKNRKYVFALVPQNVPCFRTLSDQYGIKMDEYELESTSMKLSGEETEQLHEALMSAFPNSGELQLLVRTGLDENLNVISEATKLGDKVSDLIQWAESKGRLNELVEKAYQKNPQNPVLQHFVLSQLPAQAEQLRTAVAPACRAIAEIIKHTTAQSKKKMLLEEIADAQSKEKMLLEEIVGNVRALVSKADETSPTRYIGKFPTFFKDHIIPNLEGAQQESLCVNIV